MCVCACVCVWVVSVLKFLQSSYGWMNFPHQYSDVFQWGRSGLSTPKWLNVGVGLHVSLRNMMQCFFGLKWSILLVLRSVSHIRYIMIYESISFALVICIAPLTIARAIIRWSCVVQHSTTASPTCRHWPLSSVFSFKCRAQKSEKSCRIHWFEIK